MVKIAKFGAPSGMSPFIDLPLAAQARQRPSLPFRQIIAFTHPPYSVGVPTDSNP